MTPHGLREHLQTSSGILPPLLLPRTVHALKAMFCAALTACMYRDWTRTTFLRGDDEEYTLATRGRMMERLQVILAGRAAEEITFDTPTTYSIPDLRVSSLCYCCHCQHVP